MTRLMIASLVLLVALGGAAAAQTPARGSLRSRPASP